MKHTVKKSYRQRGLLDLRRAYDLLQRNAERRSEDINSLAEEHREALISRRRFMQQAGKAAAVISIAGLYEACKPKQKETTPVIVIVGAGIAGLHAAYVLKNAGYIAEVYEGSPRTGGRIMSVTDMMGDGLWTEFGGEFIDTEHEDMLNLARKFELPLLDRAVQSEKELKEFAYYFGGKPKQLDDVLKELQPFAEQIRKDIDSISDEVTYEQHSDADVRLDNMSITAYIDSLGIKGWFRDFINVSYTAEYGMEADEQSALNFLSLFDPGDASQYKPFGESDERFSIVGGNQKLTDVLAARLAPQIHTEHILRAISQKQNRYVLTFGTGSTSSTDVEADVVLITLPFSVLRDVDIRIELPDWKLNAIKNLGYGTNSKLFVGVEERVWRKQGYSGYAFSDNTMMTGYDHTQMQTSNEGRGGYTIFLGGKPGIDCGTPSLEDLQKVFVPALDQVFPGVNAAFNGRFQRWHWPSYVFSKCSYVSFKAGQYTTISGAIQKPVGNLFFAGEHCSYEFQGFMNGGAKTGREAAEAIIQKLKT